MLQEKDGEDQLDRSCDKLSIIRVKEERNILHTINRTGHILRRNCFLKHVTEGNIEGRIEITRRRGRRCKKLLDDL